MNKEKYEVPVMEIVEFETEDVITTSGDIDEGEVQKYFMEGRQSDDLPALCLAREKFGDRRFAG